jgi:hypothetical protein
MNKKEKSPLDGLYVTTPCTVGFENMAGDERVRFWLKIAAAIALIIPCLAFVQSVSAQGLVGAPVDIRYGQSHTIGPIADWGYDQAYDMSRLATALSSVPALFLGLRKIIRAVKQPLLIRGLKIKAIAAGIALIIGIPLVVHLIGTFIINNVGGYAGGL